MSKPKKMKNDGPIKVYVVYNTFVSFRNGGHETDIYVCKDQKVADKTAKECHMNGMCGRLENYDGEGEIHTYKECNERKQNIRIEEEEICLSNNVIAQFNVRT
jgi:hypothetical protein